MNGRKGNVDLAKFVAALIIMSHHLYSIGFLEYPFSDGWVFVELFLLITGYFTAKHYDAFVTVNKSKEALTYTIRKFLPIFPYILLVNILGWITRGMVSFFENEHSIKFFLASFMGDFPFDVLMLTGSFSTPLIGPLWYLYALILVFPLFSLLMQMGSRYSKIIICGLLPLLYYGWMGVRDNGNFPHNLLRVMCGLMLGALLYELTIMFMPLAEKIPKWFLTVVEAVTCGFPIVGCLFGLAADGWTTFRVYLLCFFIWLMICLPGFSYSKNIGGKVVNFLGRLSLPIYIFHWYVGTLVNLASEKFMWDNSTKIVVYFAGTFLLSIIALVSFGKWKWLQRIVSAKVELP